MSAFNHLVYFKPSEFTNPEKMDPELLKRLDRAREMAGVPFKITSSWRPPDSTVGIEDSTHKLGKAVDIECRTSHNRFQIVKALLWNGFTRVGVYDQHIHADIGTPAEGFPDQVLWTGKST